MGGIEKPKMTSSRDSSGKSAAAGVALGVGATAIGAFMATKLNAQERSDSIPSQESQDSVTVDRAVSPPSATETWNGDISWLNQSNYLVHNDNELLQLLELAETNGIPLEEINKIDALVKHNLENGVDVLFSSEYGSGYLGTYDPTHNLITIMPETVDMGYEDVLKVMTHETVHAEQDIADGIDNDTYAMIGTEINSHGVYNVENYYSDQSHEVQLLELEANSSEVEIDATLDHMGVEC
jgi:hypothetical protein